MSIEYALGRLLRRVRAGEHHLAWHRPELRDVPASIRLGSPAFADGAPMPLRFGGAGVGENVSPPLAWADVPAEAVELVLLLEDPDAPLPRPVVHLVATGIAPAPGGVAEGALTPAASPQIRFGRGAFGRVGYAGPRPVRGHGPHRYVFELFALRETLAATGVPDLRTVLDAVGRSALARGRLTGLFERGR